MGILAEEIGTAIERIDNWLGKPVVIMCNEVTTAHLPHMLKCACNISIELNQLFLITEWMIYILTCFRVFIVVTTVRCPAQLHWETIGPPILNKIPGIPQFSGTEREKDTVSVRTVVPCHFRCPKNFNEQLVRAAITKSCVGDVARCHVLFATGGYFG